MGAETKQSRRCRWGCVLCLFGALIGGHWASGVVVVVSVFLQVGHGRVELAVWVWVVVSVLFVFVFVSVPLWLLLVQLTDCVHCAGR